MAGEQRVISIIVPVKSCHATPYGCYRRDPGRSPWVRYIDFARRVSWHGRQLAKRLVRESSRRLRAGD